jgi:hypothetical protein
MQQLISLLMSSQPLFQVICRYLERLSESMDVRLAFLATASIHIASIPHNWIRKAWRQSCPIGRTMDPGQRRKSHEPQDWFLCTAISSFWWDFSEYDSRKILSARAQHDRGDLIAVQRNHNRYRPPMLLHSHPPIHFQGVLPLGRSWKTGTWYTVRPEAPTGEVAILSPWSWPYSQHPPPPLYTRSVSFTVIVSPVDAFLKVWDVHELSEDGLISYYDLQIYSQDNDWYIVERYIRWSFYPWHVPGAQRQCAISHHQKKGRANQKISADIYKSIWTPSTPNSQSREGCATFRNYGNTSSWELPARCVIQ